jgi:hypothetical protein
MPAPLLTELPYRADSTTLFETIADWPWAVFLDSGRHHPGQSRYDILAAQPYIRLVTRGQMTEVHGISTLIQRFRAMPAICLFAAAPSGISATILRAA